MPLRLLISYLIVTCACMHSYAQIANRYNVVIDEILADPTPVVGLPNAEFIELKNVSDSAFNLKNWKIINGSAIAIIEANFILHPDSCVIICATSSAKAYFNFGATIGVAGFPSLNNADIISLQSPQSLIIHTVGYDKSWYQNDIKSAGGWSLEMIDTKNPCTGFENWKASTNINGGTPGQKNSVDGINKDEQPPTLLRTYTIDSVTIVAVFNEPLDSNSASNISNYSIDNSINNPTSAVPQLPLFTQVIFKLPAKLSANIIYHLTSKNISDCVGNISAANIVKVGLPVLSDTNDIVINEILFNPKTSGYDYAEFYNRSNKVIDLQQLYVATRDATGLLKSITQISATPLLFFPGDYYVITGNTLWVEQNYLVKNPDNMIQLPSLPSFADDDGTIVLLNQNEKVIDELHYNSSWQLAIIPDPSGIALERIDYNKSTQDPGNWASAASTAGYGTPTYQNSEFQFNQFAKGEINISPKIFSPDNDGYEDYCFINYIITAPGYVANINIYDASGRVVRNIAANATLALTGTFRWDGLDDKQQKSPVGIYIIVTQIFDLTGKTKQFKNVVTLARRM